jgi:hypothetical protein
MVELPLIPISRFIATDIITPTALQIMKDRGLEFATVDSAVKCLMRIVSDTKVNGNISFLYLIAGFG